MSLKILYALVMHNETYTQKMEFQGADNCAWWRKQYEKLWLYFYLDSYGEAIEASECILNGLYNIYVRRKSQNPETQFTILWE